MIGLSAAFFLVFSLAGASNMSASKDTRAMSFSIESFGVYGAAAPLALEMTEAGTACAVNLSHDLRKDMSLRVFTGIGSRCLPLSEDMSRSFAELAGVVMATTSSEPARGEKYLQYSINDYSRVKSGRLAIVEESQAMADALGAFYSLHLKVSSQGEVKSGIRPELRLLNDRTIELSIHNIGECAVSISSPQDWEDSYDPTVPNVTASIWNGADSTVAVLGPKNWRPFEHDGAISIEAGETVSMQFDLDGSNIEKVKYMADGTQIAGRVRFHVQFENGPRGMATGAINAVTVYSAN